VIRADDTAPLRLIVKRLNSGAYRRDADGALEKRCTVCRDYWPADSEFFYAGRSESDGLHSHCKACYIELRNGARIGASHQPDPITA
jgi:hypothetical protein